MVLIVFRKGRIEWQAQCSLTPFVADRKFPRGIAVFLTIVGERRDRPKIDRAADSILPQQPEGLVANTWWHVNSKQVTRMPGVPDCRRQPDWRSPQCLFVSPCQPFALWQAGINGLDLRRQQRGQQVRQ